MNNRIKIAVLPLDISWCNYEMNMATVADELRELESGTDIVVLPELFSTGFIQDAALIDRMATTYGVRAIEAVKRWCAQYNVAIAGSVLIKDEGKYYNRGFFAEPSGEIAYYDKRHLFCLSPEAEIFSQGDKLPPVVRYRGWNISLVVCYDLRFPVWCRNTGNRYDMLIVPANWPSTRGYAWRQLLIARAIENQALVVGVDRSGCDDYGDYDFMSYVFDAAGREIAPCCKDKVCDIDASSVIPGSDAALPSCGINPNGLFYATYTKDELNKMRRRLPVGADGDTFELNIK